MKLEACPVEPPGLGSGPLSISTRSRQPSRARWWTRLLPTMPAPITTARALAGRMLAAPDCSSTEVTSGVADGGLGSLIYHNAMHSSRELTSSSFEISVDGAPARLEDLFEGFGEHDRLGVVVRHPFGAVGASGLITATVTAFYDIQRSRGPGFFIYPDYFLFHVGGPLGDHGMLDVWPRHKEVVVPEEPERILEAINDRAITRLVVEDGEPGEPAFEREALASARARIVTCLAYSPAGRVENPDVRIAANGVTEGYVEQILGSEGGRLLARQDLLEGGVPVETYGRIARDEALERLG